MKVLADSQRSSTVIDMRPQEQENGHFNQQLYQHVNFIIGDQEVDCEN